MASRQAVHTDQAPAAIGPYSQGMRAGDLLFISGQLPIDPASGDMPDAEIGELARLCLQNMAAIASAGSGSLESAVKVTIFLTDMGDFARVNEVYAQFFSEPYPARAAIQVAGLPKGARIEMEAVVAMG